MPICIDKPTLIHIITSSLFLLLYGIVMFVTGIIMTLFAWFMYKTGAYRKPRRFIEALKSIIKHWDEIKEFW